MLQMIGLAASRQTDNVKTRRNIPGIVLLEPEKRALCKAPLFGCGNGPFRAAKIRILPGFHFHKYQIFLVPANQVQFKMAVAPVARKNFIAASRKVVFGGVFALPSQLQIK